MQTETIILLVQTVFVAAYGAPLFFKALQKKKKRHELPKKVYGIAYNSGKGSINYNHVLVPKNANGSVGIIGNSNDGDIIGNVFIPCKNS